MRSIILFSIALMLSVTSLSQDKKLLEKQLADLLKDNPNKFKNLRNPKDTFLLKFEISGTFDPPFIMNDEGGTYISTSLGFLEKEADTKSWFNDWVTMINSLSLNGYTLKSEDCSGGKLNAYCMKWKIDNSKNNVPAKYLSFTIKLRYANAGEEFVGSLYVGDLK